MQRAIFGVAAAVILTGVLAMGLRTESIRYVPLSLGKQFSPEDLTNIEQSLRDQSLTTYHREGNRLLVPENELTDYDAALLQARQLPQDWASEWERKFEETNPFTSSRKLQMLKEIALAKELKRIIQGLDGIEEANVVWAETATNSWPAHQQKVTASVNLRPKPGVTLSEQTIRAIQFSVANMVPNLDPENVIVLDYSAGRHYQLQPEQARFETDLQRWVDREVTRWQERLTASIVHHWPVAQLEVRPQQEELRQVAWQLMQSIPSDPGQERSFQQVEQELQRRFPEYMQLIVTLPVTDDPSSSPAPGQPSLEEEVFAALVGWLPATFDVHQLRVAEEFSSPVAADVDEAGSQPTRPAWQSVVLIGVAGVLLLVVSRRISTSSDSMDPLRATGPETLETQGLESIAENTEQTVNSSTPITPLGDPELVADVLKQWLSSSQVGHLQTPAKDSREG